MSFILVIRDKEKIYRGGMPMLVKDTSGKEHLIIDFCSDDAPSFFRVPWQYLSKTLAEWHKRQWEKENPKFAGRVEII